MGSAVSITVALILTLIVFLMLPEYAERIGEEFPPLLWTLLGSATIAAVAALGFYGELRESAWRRIPQLVLVLLLTFIGWYVWPEK